MIRRGPRPADRFAMIANEALENSSLTWRARGVLAYLLSRPEGWSTSAERLATQSPKGKEGRDAMRSVLTELETAGYIVRERVQDARGRWSTGMVVYDFPAKTAAEPPIVESRPSTAGVLHLPDTMAFATDDGSSDELAAHAAELLSKPLVVEDAKNGGSPGVGQPAVGSPAVGKPGVLNKTETKTKNKTESSSEDPLVKLQRWPGPQYIATAIGRWSWINDVDKMWALTQKYLADTQARGYRYSEDGWLKFMEREDREREIRTRGRAYAPNGVPL